MSVSSRTTSRLTTVAAAVASALAYPLLPRRVATHFDEEGNPNGYRSRMAAAVGVPAMMLALQAADTLFGAWPGGRDREDRNSGAQARNQAIAVLEVSFLSGQLAILANAAGLRIDMGRVNRAIYGVLMLGLGNILPKLPRNGLIGIRTPWTLADPAIWERTNRFGGYLVTAAGLVTLASLPAKGKRTARLPVIATISAIGLACAYSLIAYMRSERSDHR